MKYLRNITYVASILLVLISMLSCNQGNKTLWSLGKIDSSSSEFAMGPSGFSDYMEKDFGFEDRYFIVGYSDLKKDFPYTLPGPVDTWGGSWGTACWSTHDINLLFSLEQNSMLQSRTNLLKTVHGSEKCKLTVNLLGVAPKGAVVKLDINNLLSTRFDLQAGEDTVIYGGPSSKPETLEFEFPVSCLYDGGNTIKISVLEGSWIVFDEVNLQTPASLSLDKKPDGAYIRSVSVADYKCGDIQPLLVDVECLKENTLLSVLLDSENIFEKTIDTSRYIFEVPMPVVQNETESRFEIFINNKPVQAGTVIRKPDLSKQTLADYVDTKMGTGHSRWMIAPGPWMPFSMVKVSPDNQNPGWQAGYQPTFESVGCFSHIHEWTMAGLGVMPTNGPVMIKTGDERNPEDGYRSRIDKRSEKAGLGLYEVYLTDSHILADVTATTRASMMKFVFPDSIDGRVMIDLNIPAEYYYQLKEVKLQKINDFTIQGTCHQLTPNVWSDDADQDYTVNFYMEFDTPIKNSACWVNDSIIQTSEISGKDLKDAGIYVEFDTKQKSVVKVRTGISFVSVKNAETNLRNEISNPFGWDFQAVVNNQKETWNEILNRVEIKTSDRLEKIRFYTNLFRAHCRNTFSDVNGQWVNPDEKVSKLKSSDDLALGCDAFWNTFWNLNQVWNLITPEWSSRWVRSELALYDACGWLSKGPAGMQYIPVMVGEHEIPLMVSAYQMGIRDYDVNKVLEAAVKMQTTPSRRIKGGYVGNRDLVSYLKYHYVPYELGTFSNSIEYSYDDWTVGQLAKSLGRESLFKEFNDRGSWWKSAMNEKNGYLQVKDSNGNFAEPFDPFKTHINGRLAYTEGNAWQLSFFVPQDPVEMVKVIGKERFLDRLQWGFSESETWRYNSPNERYDAYPVVQGNQQSMHFAFLFNWAGKPWLTQKWSRSIIDRYYGYGNVNAYLGDEDQGQMSGWFVMAALGLFQTDGGCNSEPIYEIASPIFEEVTINLGGRYGRGSTFKIIAEGASRSAKYIQSATLNGKELDSFKFPASELLKGGELILKMSNKPNYNWGLK